MTDIDRPTAIAAADHVLTMCGGLAASEGVLVIADDATADIAQLFFDRARAITPKVEICRIPEANMHGAEPALEIAAAMEKADLIVGLTTMSLAHTEARYRATKHGARYLSMPDYSWELLVDPSLMVDFRAAEAEVRTIADRLSDGAEVRITSAAGTDMTIDITGRQGNACPGSVLEPGSLGSPPDIEANVAPIETGSDGIVVVDGSIPCREIGLLPAPITLIVENGLITSFRGETETVDLLNRMFDTVGSSARVLAECGIGMNRAAKLQGKMLTDEGAFGCVHFGFGSNATIGGLNRVSFHLDFVFRDVNLWVDGVPLIEQGNIVI